MPVSCRCLLCYIQVTFTDSLHKRIDMNTKMSRFGTYSITNEKVDNDNVYVYKLHLIF
ncbi:hypothetical protein HMPREF0083_00084 [Aneurinibacillus aneurinilyticus ATCC 12856]|uniref:Uncharacterized protein n=1 Tax=Aneurinibacillus aneurinilyticus ATCC 12856 TaxID=649747 RepID=U1XA54_ANEAE|nr:hypothetical protein HMPREF0083_00084 [Aneurinibacillus aneurinilyticus ATCC 12856]